MTVDENGSAPAPAAPSLAWIVVAGICAVAGLVLFVFAWGYYQQHVREGRWTRTPGRLLEVTSKAVGSGSSSSIRVLVRYEYEVHGEVHRSRQVSTGRDHYSFDSDRDAAHRIATLRQAKPLWVWVDPKRPARAVLEREGQTAFGPLFTFAGMLWFGTVLCLLWYGRGRRRHRRHLSAAGDAP